MTGEIRLGRRVFVIALLAFAMPTYADDVSYGTLPRGALSTNELTGVSAEICRDHLFDPHLVRARLPRGYHLIPAAEYAKDDPAAADLIKGQKKYRAYAVGSLCFVSVSSFIVDGQPVHSTAPTSMAFWWAHATGPRDSRMQGKVEWVQLASWYSEDITDRARVIASDPMAQFVELSVTQSEPGLWHLRMALAHEVIEAQVRGSGARKPRKSPQPGFMSVPFTGKSAGSFWVTTYFGHYHQPATGEWHATGSGVFNNALSIPGESAVFKTIFQDGWSALSGVYRSRF
jgi:hypothetical protein